MSNLNDFLNLESNVPKREIEINFHFDTTEEVNNYVENLVSNPDSKDPFWDDMAKNLLLSVIYLQLATQPEEKQNLHTCLEIITKSLDTIDSGCYLSEMINLLPFNHIAAMHYKTISIMPPKTFKSVFKQAQEILLKTLETTNNTTNTENQFSNN